MLQNLLVNYIIATWFRRTLLGQWFSHSSVAHTNSVAKVFQSLLLTGNSFRLLVFRTNLIAFRCQCSLARRATAFRSLAVHFLVARSKSASPSPVATARQVSSQCHHLRRRRYSRWRACLPALLASLAGELACQRLLSVAAACLPSQPSPPLRLARPQIQTLNLKS